MVELCIRLNWYLRLCKRYSQNDNIAEEHDYYIIRYLVIVFYVLVFSREDLRSMILKVCSLGSKDVLDNLKEMGKRFLYGEYSYIDTIIVLNLLKLLCPCLDKVLSLLC